MAGNNGNGNGPQATAKARLRWAGFLLVVSVVFFVVTAVFHLDLAKPAWGMFFVGVYVIFGNVVGDFLLRAITGMAATAKEDSDYGSRHKENREKRRPREGGLDDG